MPEGNYHPAADAFPMMDAKRFAELKADIALHGVRVPITLCDGKILDGRNRDKAYRELQAEGVVIDPPKSSEFDGDPWAYVWSLNGQRRDLNGRQRSSICILCRKNSEEWESRQIEIANKAERQRRSAADSRRGVTSTPIMTFGGAASMAAGGIRRARLGV